MVVGVISSTRKGRIIRDANDSADTFQHASRAYIDAWLFVHAVEHVEIRRADGNLCPE